MVCFRVRCSRNRSDLNSTDRPSTLATAAATPSLIIRLMRIRRCSMAATEANVARQAFSVGTDDSADVTGWFGGLFLLCFDHIEILQTGAGVEQHYGILRLEKSAGEQFGIRR